MAINYDESLGQIIKRKRLQLGMSLRDLAKEAGVTHVAILRIEEDKYKIVDPKILALESKTKIFGSSHVQRES